MNALTDQHPSWPPPAADVQALLDLFAAGSTTAKAQLVELAHDSAVAAESLPRSDGDRTWCGLCDSHRPEEGHPTDLRIEFGGDLDDARPQTVRDFVRLVVTCLRRRRLEVFPVAMLLLTDDERELAGRIFRGGQSQAEAAAALGVHEDSVKRRWAKLRCKVQDTLQAEDEHG